MAYQTEWAIRFGDVDAAGIVYYPRLFDRVVRVVEELLEELGRPVDELIEDGIGMPIVNVEADLLAPIRLGDTLSVSLSPSLGDSSVTYAVSFERSGERVAIARQTMVAIDLETFETRSIPPDLRAALEAT